MSMKGFAARFSTVTGLLVALIMSLAKTASAPQVEAPVGGEVVAVNPLAILAPYLVLIAAIAIVLLAIWKSVLAGKIRLERLTL